MPNSDRELERVQLQGFATLLAKYAKEHNFVVTMEQVPSSHLHKGIMKLSVL